MSIRELPHFLKHGFPDGPAPREYPRPGRMRFPELRPVPEGSCGDVLNLREEAVRGWLKAVELGLVGGCVGRVGMEAICRSREIAYAKTGTADADDTRQWPAGVTARSC